MENEMSVLKLQEVLWEITPKCDKGCSYCGSKDIINKKPLDDNDLIKIAKQLVEYGVEEVTLTGGEPGTLAEENPEIIPLICNILNEGGTKTKVVTYGKIVEIYGERSLELFDVIGISVNELADIECVANLPINPHYQTMITNFGRHNIWDFDELAECAKKFNCWQIQLTMGNEVLNPEGIKHLRNKIGDCDVTNSDTTIVLADNLQVCHKCMAGIKCCSITYTGDVAACLSERSYGGVQNIYGNLLKEDIGEIWENEFKDVRFKDCRKCCRDHIEYPEIDENHRSLPPIIIKGNDQGYPNPINPQVTLYGVSPGGGTYVYSVANPYNPGTGHPPLGDGSVVMMYAVWTEPRWKKPQDNNPDGV